MSEQPRMTPGAGHPFDIRARTLLLQEVEEIIRVLSAIIGKLG